MHNTEELDDRPSRKPFQFDTRSFFWLMVAIGLALTYLRAFGNHIIVQALMAVAGSAVVAIAVGWIYQPPC